MSSLVESKIAKAAHLRIEADRFYVLLEDGRELGIPYTWFWRLAAASHEQRQNWRLIGDGTGICWEDLDEDLSVEGLLEGRRGGK
jgi:hypothetical protein